MSFYEHIILSYIEKYNAMIVTISIDSILVITKYHETTISDFLISVLKNLKKSGGIDEQTVNIVYIGCWNVYWMIIDGLNYDH